MPSKNRIKTYVENGYYHIYNRGVEKRLLFKDAEDYGVYLSYLKDYLSPKDDKEVRSKLLANSISRKDKAKIRKLLTINNFFDEITLLAYCLMPNHFHLFIKQQDSDSIDKFMKSISTRYVMYFNRKYRRVGPLYQDRYKAALITDEAHYLHLTRYIHHQALMFQGPSLEQQPSSYPEYIGTRNTVWVHPEEILSFFSNNGPASSYAKFVADINAMNADKQFDLAIEDD